MSRRTGFVDKEAVLDQMIESPTPAPVIEPDIEICLTKSDLHELSPYLSRNIHSKDDLLIACRRLSTCTVDGLEITLDPALLSRLKSHCIGQPFGPYLKDQIVRLLRMDIGF